MTLPPPLALALALAVMTVGAEVLVRGASALALRAGLSSLFVGVAVVGIGTSTPELAASLIGTLEGSTGLAVGNVVGSNIFNVGVILGVTALLRPLRVELRLVKKDVLVALAVAGLPLVALAFGGRLPRGAGVVLLALLVTYLARALRAGRRAKAEERARMEAEVRTTLTLQPPAAGPSSAWVHGALVVLGLGALAFGSRWFVVVAIDLARAQQVSERVIGLTIVSAGTSLPELVTSIVAAHRRNPDIVLGNVLGSNIFNVLGVLGACTLVRAQEIPAAMLALDVPVMILLTLAVLPILRTGAVVSRAEGAGLVATYGLYLAWLLLRS